MSARNFGEPAEFKPVVRPREGDDDAATMASFVLTRDRKMFGALFQKYRRAMVAYAGRYVRDPARAEELAQEVFVRVYKTKAYQADASFKTWLYKVATNVCLNEVRRPEHRQAFESIDAGAAGDEPKAELPAPSDASPEARLSEQELARRLERVLAGLPEKQRAAFLMVRHEAMTHEEIAQALDTSVSAVKSLVHRALEALRRELSALEVQP